jgi:tetratricopeptide (TPR) repeat protein
MCFAHPSNFDAMAPITIRTSMRSAITMALWASLALAHAQGSRELIAQGDSLLAAGKASKAMESYDKAVKQDLNANTLCARARASYAMGRMDRFLLDVEQALKLDSLHAEANYQRGLYAIRSSDPLAAERHATKAITYGTDELLRANAYLLRGEALAEQKRNAAAIEDLERGLAKVKDATESMRVLAQLYDAAGRYADALALLERLCELEPEFMGNWTNRSFELIQLERYDEALTMVQRALLIDKDEPVALSHRAYIHLKTGRDKEALADVDRSLRSFPNNPYALRTRALLRLQKGELEKACKDLTLAKSLGSIAEVDQLVQQHCGAIPSGKGK